jgi:hypothetical protein
MRELRDLKETIIEERPAERRSMPPKATFYEHVVVGEGKPIATIVLEHGAGHSRKKPML